MFERMSDLLEELKTLVEVEYCQACGGFGMHKRGCPQGKAGSPTGWMTSDPPVSGQVAVGGYAEVTAGSFEKFIGKVDAINQTKGEASLTLPVFGKPTLITGIKLSELKSVASDYKEHPFKIGDRVYIKGNYKLNSNTGIVVGIHKARELVRVNTGVKEPQEIPYDFVTPHDPNAREDY